MVSDFLGVPVYEGDIVVLSVNLLDDVPGELRVGLVMGLSSTKLNIVTTKNRLAHIDGNKVIKVPYFNVDKETRDTLHKIVSIIYQ